MARIRRFDLSPTADVKSTCCPVCISSGSGRTHALTENQGSSPAAACLALGGSASHQPWVSANPAPACSSPTPNSFSTSRTRTPDLPISTSTQTTETHSLSVPHSNDTQLLFGNVGSGHTLGLRSSGSKPLLHVVSVTPCSTAEGTSFPSPTCLSISLGLPGPSRLPPPPVHQPHLSLPAYAVYRKQLPSPHTHSSRRA